VVARESGGIRARARAASALQWPAEMNDKRKKILLVDDSSTALMIEQMLLNKARYDIVTARDGVEAVTKASMEMPDLILMDVVMPHMNGFEACAKIRAQEQTSRIPIILVTTRGEHESIESGFAAGCNDYVTKPINGLELLTKLRDQLGE
jgi:PleD family two-component response regulator